MTDKHRYTGRFNWLARAVRNKIGELRAPDGGTTKVVEAAGRSILSGLRNPDPGVKPGCQFDGSGAIEKCLIDPRQTCWGSRCKELGIVVVSCQA